MWAGGGGQGKKYAPGRRKPVCPITPTVHILPRAHWWWKIHPSFPSTLPFAFRISLHSACSENLRVKSEIRRISRSRVPIYKLLCSWQRRVRKSGKTKRSNEARPPAPKHVRRSIGSRSELVFLNNTIRFKNEAKIGGLFRECAFPIAVSPRENCVRQRENRISISFP